MDPYVVTIDGPSGSGKGSLALLLARLLGFSILDSGAIYRLAALKALNENVDLQDEQHVLGAIRTLDIHFETGDELTIPFLDGKDVSQQVRDEKTAAAASIVAAYPSVRTQLLAIQRDFFSPPGLVADGRDMGTTVFPDAKIKIFLNASSQIRAKRRYKQLIDMGLSANIVDLQNEIEIRDERDRSRAVSPLVPASDAVIIDCSLMELSQVVDLVMSHITDINNQRF
ncbi:MAG: (d)CMP kinase [Gammaproteobacteria bacterium]|nr:(d)CMP kinase [Gammaproteobacteria bacterium]MBL7000308.1 (d)CMP kinase [Gammaproteobacteria bacterium]